MKMFRFILQHKIVAFTIVASLLFFGMITSPFNHFENIFPNHGVAVDIIPNLGENQQIVFTEWQGQSPQNIEDQITYPLTSYFLGLPQVKTIRSSSMLGSSSIYVIFEDGADFYWARSRLTEKLTALPKDLLPQGVQPSLGPDATALGQVFWYTLEGRDNLGNTTGGWSLGETRNIQDSYVKNALASTSGVAEVASIGGHVQEYQIDIDPQLMRKYDISISQVVNAARESNLDIGAKTMEINKMEYFVRGIGQIQSVADIEEAVLKVTGVSPIKIKDIASVKIGPAERRGILDKGGAEVVGGVVTARFGENPLAVVKKLREKIKNINVGLPSKIMEDGRTSTLTIVPFYDRGVLIEETLDTLESAISNQILISILVVLILLHSFRVSLIVSALMPLVVLFTFTIMYSCNVDANIVSLSGIAIAIGTVVDMGIIMTENILRHLKDKNSDKTINETILTAANEVGGAIVTTGVTTVLSFIPVFMLTGMERKLFFPLAFTKTVALIGAVLLAIFVVPSVTALLYSKFFKKTNWNRYSAVLVALCIVILGLFFEPMAFLVLPFGIILILHQLKLINPKSKHLASQIYAVMAVGFMLAYYWRPLGNVSNVILNLLFVLLLLALVIVPCYYIIKYYANMLSWVLKNKIKSLVLPILILFLGFFAMVNLQKEFMPKLNEGDFVIMPSALPQAGVTQISETLKQLDRAVTALPEVLYVVGKAGRVNSALDPAPLSMYENLIVLKPEYIMDDQGLPRKFKSNGSQGFPTITGDTIYYGQNEAEDILIPDNNGEYYRNWRNHVKNRQDIWKEITAATELPNITSSPQLQPIETRLVMLQTGMRSNLGIKILGQDLKQISLFSLQLEKTLKEIPGIVPGSVFAERIIAKPYLIIEPNRKNLAMFGLSMKDVQNTIAVAVGGKTVTESIEGRERHAVRVRYPRGLRGSPDDLKSILVHTGYGKTVPLGSLANIGYEKGPQQIRSEDGFLVSYVSFDKEEFVSEVDIVEQTKIVLKNKLATKELIVPTGIHYEFAGSYENHIRSQGTLRVIIPLVLFLIMLVLYIQFRSVWLSIMVFSGTAVAFSGGFILLWLYGQPWFLDIGLRELFNVETINLSVAVWIGFIALFGIATDDGVVMATYLKQNFKGSSPQDIEEIRNLVIDAGKKRIKPCLMTTATTILALIPVIMSQGKGSEIMIPMAVPCLGGMTMALISLFIVPLLYAWRVEIMWHKSQIK